MFRGAAVVVEPNRPSAERRVLRQEILLNLRSGIVSGDVAPGTRLLEVPLATELGVSRGPVREALRQLEQEGLVEFFPHRGAVVVGVADAEIETIYGVRALLEERAFAKACRVVDDAELESLAETVERMIEASEAGDVEAVTEHDMAFHGRIVELSGFQYLRHMWTSIDGLVRLRTVRDAKRPELADPSSARSWLIVPSVEHRELVEALRTGRPATAARAARLHITRALERLHQDGRR
jgi:DNA-binding GntR family transcriptional regulator